MYLNRIPAVLKKYENGSVHEKGTVVGSSFYGQGRGGYGLLVTFAKNGKKATYCHNTKKGEVMDTIECEICGKREEIDCGEYHSSECLECTAKELGVNLDELLKR